MVLLSMITTKPVRHLLNLNHKRMMTTTRQGCPRSIRSMMIGTATRMRRIAVSSPTPKYCYYSSSKTLLLSSPVSITNNDTRIINNVNNNNSSTTCSSCSRRVFSSTTTSRLPASSSSSSASSVSFKTKLGLGGNNWSRMEPLQYQNVIQTTLQNGITIIEAGQEGGDQSLVDALNHNNMLHRNPREGEEEGPITVTFRIGYHTIIPEDDDAVNEDQQQRWPGDVQVEQHPFLGPNRTMEPLGGGGDEEQPMSSPLVGNSNQSSSNDDQKMIQILHNITSEYIQKELEESSLVKEYRQQQQKSIPENINMKVVALLHNPEAQIMALATDTDHYDINQVSIENRQIFLREKLVEAFVALEKAVQENSITSYGIVSNGLCLPQEHPLALSIDTILDASEVAMEKLAATTTTTACHLSVIQLPINLMERTGLEIARDLHERVFGGGGDKENNNDDGDGKNDQKYQHLRDDPPLEIYAMRPLTCYPDRGTGTGHAFRLVDYLLPSGPKPTTLDIDNNNNNNSNNNEDNQQQTIPDEELVTKQWSNLMQGPPLIYSIALRKAMSHFDAEFILEEKLKRELTAEERETLDGCKLLQSMLHDLDHGLSEVRSLGAHEQDLYTRIIPLIHDTFEEYDEDTADVLEMFFKSYSLAVRYSIANNTRRLLREGGDDGRGFQYVDLPDDAKLQDYALEYLLKEKAIDRVIVGATQPDQVSQMVKLSQRLDSKSTKEDGTETG